MSDQRFKVSIRLQVDQTVPAAKQYFDCPLCYPDITYDGVVLIEGLLVQMLEKLVQTGIAKTDDPAAVVAILGNVTTLPAAKAKA